jgi:uncharacterized membrane-anchored protein
MASRGGIVLIIAIALSVSPLYAEDASSATALDKEKAQHKRDVLMSLKYRSGQITLNEGLAEIDVPDTYRFLDGDDAQKVLVDLWENVPGTQKPLGMILPAGVNPASRGCWCVVIGWSEDGHIADDDADKIDYEELLNVMKEVAKKNNEERAANGLRSAELVGWAQPPRYDKATHKLWFATELAASGIAEHRLNYRICILGRRGLLVLNSIARMDQLEVVKQATPALLGMVDFNQGHRYVDFDPNTDKVAECGLAAMIGPGAPAKVGFFKRIWLFLAEIKFFIIGPAALAALWGVWWRAYVGKSPTNSARP